MAALDNVCYNIAAAEVDIPLIHVTTSLYPLLQSVVLLGSTLVLFSRLSTAYRTVFRKTHGTVRDQLLNRPDAPHADYISLAGSIGSEERSRTRLDDSVASKMSSFGVTVTVTPKQSSRAKAPFWRRAQQWYRRSSAPKDRMVRPVYYTYAQLLCLLFFLQIVLYLPGNTSVLSALRFGSFVFAAMFDNFIVFALITRKSFLALIGAVLVGIGYSVFAAVVIPLSSCPWCRLYVSQIPATRWIEVPYLVCAGIYILLSAAAYRRWRLPFIGTPRPALASWSLMLFITYGLGGSGMAILNNTSSTMGFCLVDLGVLLYSVMYALVLYSVMVSDTSYCNRREMLDAVQHSKARTRSTNASQLPTRTLDRLRALLNDPSLTVIPYEDVTLVKSLGDGAFGSVYAATWRGAPVAVKQLGRGGTEDWSRAPDASLTMASEQTMKLLQDLVREAAILSTLRHPNIVVLLGIVVDSHRKAMVTELVSGRTLYERLHGGGDSPLTMAEKVDSLRQCAAGMAYLHGCDPAISHNDLKSSNLLVRDSDLAVKVCDFGLSASRAVAPAAMAGALNANTTQVGHRYGTAPAGVVGTVQWAAPEVLRGEARHSEATDAFSFGVIAWECASPTAPFSGRGALRVASEVGFRGVRLPLPPVIGEEESKQRVPSAVEGTPDGSNLMPVPAQLRKLIVACFQEDATRRPTFKQMEEQLSYLLASMRPLAPRS